MIALGGLLTLSWWELRPGMQDAGAVPVPTKSPKVCVMEHYCFKCGKMKLIYEETKLCKDCTRNWLNRACAALRLPLVLAGFLDAGLA